MSAIVTNQFRINNASNFIKSVADDTDENYYVFIGLPNPYIPNSGIGRTTEARWDGNSNGPPVPVDNLDHMMHYRDLMMFGKKITSENIRRVVKKTEWIANTTYDMYRHDYDLTDINYRAPNSGLSLYESNYYVITDEYRVYICLYNGSSPSTPKGNPVKEKPTHTTLEDPPVGDDGYIWKYLFTIAPNDIVKFDSTEYIVLPNNWETTTDSEIERVRNAANSDIGENQIQQVYVKDGGSDYKSGTHPNIPILGDGSGAQCTVTVEGSTNSITKVVVTAGGSGYTFGAVDLSTIRTNSVNNTAVLVPIIPPSKGHGYDLYSELGADKVLIYARFDDSTENFPVTSKFAQIGIIKNILQYSETTDSELFDDGNFSALYAIKLTDSYNSSILPRPGMEMEQDVNNSNSKARGWVASYDPTTKVLKYIQDRTLYFNQDTRTRQDIGLLEEGDSNNTKVDIQPFESSTNSITFKDASDAGQTSLPTAANVDTTFGTTESPNNKITVDSKEINLEVNFVGGIAKPEINKKTGEILYIDNRFLVDRDPRQKEDIKIVLEF